MPILTTVTGALYDISGNKLTSGELLISLADSFVSIDGNRLSPFEKEYAVIGDISFSLFATENTVVGSSYTSLNPLGVRYLIEFDPLPLDTTVIKLRKRGYFRNSVSIPHVSDTALSNVYELWPVNANPVTTTITGAVYNPSGTKLTTGSLIITPTSDFTAIDGSKVIAKSIVVPVTGDVSFSLFATDNEVNGSIYNASTSIAVNYVVEYNPDAVIAELATKDGYFKSTISVPHVSDSANLNTIDFAEITPNEYQYYTAKYSYPNIFDNDYRLLTSSQNLGLVHGNNADALHTHSGVTSGYLSLQTSLNVSTPTTNKMFIFLSSSTVPTKSSVNLKFEDASLVHLFYD